MLNECGLLNLCVIDVCIASMYNETVVNLPLIEDIGHWETTLGSLSGTTFKLFYLLEYKLDH